MGLFGSDSSSSSETRQEDNRVVGSVGVTIGARGKQDNSIKLGTGAQISYLPDNAVKVVEAAIGKVSDFGAATMNNISAANKTDLDTIQTLFNNTTTALANSAAGQTNIQKILPWVIVGAVALAFIMYRK